MGASRVTRGLRYVYNIYYYYYYYYYYKGFYNAHLEEESLPRVVVLRDGEHALGVDCDHAAFGAERGPRARGARVLQVRGLEDVASAKQRVVEREALAVARVPDDRDNLDRDVWGARELVAQLRRVLDLPRPGKSCQPSIKRLPAADPETDDS